MSSHTSSIISIAISLLAAGVFCSCSGNRQLNTSYYEDKGSVPLNNSPVCNSSYDYSVTVEYPVSIIPKNNQQIIDSMDVAILRVLYGDDMIQMALDGRLAGSSGKYDDEKSVTTRIIYAIFENKVYNYRQEFAGKWAKNHNLNCNSNEIVEIYNTATHKGIATFVVYRSVESGGRKVLEKEKGISFSLKDGHIVTEEELFRGKNWKSVLHETLSEQIKVQCSPELAENIDFQKVQPNNNFLLDKKSIIYLFDTKDLGSQESVLIRIKIPFSEIRKITR